MSEIQIKAQKFAGKWKQESTENVEALNKKLGLNWAIRKVANVMDVNIEIVPNPEVSSSSSHFKRKSRGKKFNFSLKFYKILRVSKFSVSQIIKGPQIFRISNFLWSKIFTASNFRVLKFFKGLKLNKF